MCLVLAASACLNFKSSRLLWLDFPYNTRGRFLGKASQRDEGRRGERGTHMSRCWVSPVHMGYPKFQPGSREGWGEMEIPHSDDAWSNSGKTHRIGNKLWPLLVNVMHHIRLFLWWVADLLCELYYLWTNGVIKSRNRLEWQILLLWNNVFLVLFLFISFLRPLAVCKFCSMELNI